MTLTNIEDIADTGLSSAPTRGLDLEEWASFYAQVNNYEEPERPSAALVGAVRDSIRETLAVPMGQHEYGDDGLSLLSEGRSFLVGISPGIIMARSTDIARADRTNDKNADGHKAKIDATLIVDEETGEIIQEDLSGAGSKAEITEWSAKSRAHMTKTLLSLDYSVWGREDGSLAMVTLTLPGDWKPLAPDGKTFKKLVDKFRKRFVRNVGPWRCLWKLEFQRRGAPHWHGLLRVPAMVGDVTFEKWLAKSWADVVGASKEIDTIDQDGTEHSEYSRHLSAGTGLDFSGKDFSDPRRISMYFAGHSAKSQDGKEYQNVVPAKWRRPGAGPGRFWGFSGLETSLVELEMTQRDYDRLRREMRKMARSRSWEIAVKRRRGHAFRDALELHQDAAAAALSVDAAKIRAPRLRRSMYGGGGGQNGGWVMLNDALSVVRGLAGWLAESPYDPAWVGYLGRSGGTKETRKRFGQSDSLARFLWDQEFSRLSSKRSAVGAELWVDAPSAAH